MVLAALDLTFYEIANVVVRWRRADVGVQCRHIEIARGRRVARAEHSLMREASELAREHGLTAYDAAYVSAARRHGWTLVSSDVADLVSPGFALSPGAAIGA